MCRVVKTLALEKLKVERTNKWVHEFLEKEMWTNSKERKRLVEGSSRKVGGKRATEEKVGEVDCVSV